MASKSSAQSIPPLKKRTSQTPARELARLAVEAALSKKARDISVMDMRDVSGVADFFVLCTGESELQTRAIVDAVEESIREDAAERPWHREGVQHMTWVLLDYVDVVVHVFNAERRSFYDLERLWGDAPVEHVADDGSEVEMLKD
jgi:ribosome-associated protein